MVNGILNIYKEKGYTSHDVVAKLRKILHQKKIGHTGTLDPDAEGVLPVCLGAATKLCDMLTDRDKQYRTVLLLGMTTDTQDISGNVLERAEVTADKEQAAAAIESFVGDYEQVPPMYSALKVNGRRLYELAREGKTVERSARPVKIHEIEIEKIELPRITMRVSCSKGTYIRTLCHDIGVRLGCGGCMAYLQRTKAGPFLAEESMTLAEIEKLAAQDKLAEYVTAIDAMFAQYPAYASKTETDRLLHNGNALKIRDLEAHKEETASDGAQIRVYDSAGNFCAVYVYCAEKKRYQPLKMFLT